MSAPLCPSCNERMSNVERGLGGVWSCVYCEGVWLPAGTRSAATPQPANLDGTSKGMTCPNCRTKSLLALADRQDRGFSAVTSSDEDIWKLTLDFEVAEWLTARTTLRHQERTADQYDHAYFEESFPIGEPAEAEANEGMRRYYWTDRERDAFTLQLDETVTEKITLNAEAA